MYATKMPHSNSRVRCGVVVYCPSIPTSSLSLRGRHLTSLSLVYAGDRKGATEEDEMRVRTGVVQVQPEVVTGAEWRRFTAEYKRIAELDIESQRGKARIERAEALLELQAIAVELLGIELPRNEDQGCLFSIDTFRLLLPKKVTLQ